MRHRSKRKSMIRFILCVIVVGWIPDFIHSHSLCRMDHRQIQSYGKGNQLSSDRSGSISFYPVDIRCEADCYQENAAADVPVLYIGNHRSFFDVPITYPRCPIRTGYIAKKEMEKVPLLSTWMKRLHCLFLDRNDLRQGLKTILTAIEKVKSGISICIFPEIHRTKMKMNWTCFHSMRQLQNCRKDRLSDHPRWRSAAP